jgi:hypothetical protein
MRERASGDRIKEEGPGDSRRNRTVSPESIRQRALAVGINPISAYNRIRFEWTMEEALTPVLDIREEAKARGLNYGTVYKRLSRAGR